MTESKEWRAKTYIDTDDNQHRWCVAMLNEDGDADAWLADKLTESQAKLIAAAPDLADALEAVWKLIENGDLVRNIENDGDGPTFVTQAMSITVSLKKAQAALTKAGRAVE